MNKRLILMVLTLASMRNSVLARFEKFNQDMVNWTTCYEFVNNTQLDADQLLDIEWKIFYFWNPDIETSYDIRFSKPSSTLVDRFRMELDKDIVPPANWSNAELFMETSINFSALLLKTVMPGIFRMIPASAFEYNIRIPELLFGLKLVGPYLGISNCKFRICYALAPVDKMPYHYELEKAAKTLKINNPHNRSHIAYPPIRTTGVPYADTNLPDDDQIEDLEVDQDMRVNMF